MDEGSPIDAAFALDQMRRLEPIMDVALAHLELGEMLPQLLDRVRDALEVDTVAVLLLDEDANELIARAARGIEEEVERGVRIPVGRGFAGRIAGERRPIVIDDLERADVVNPILREKGIEVLMGVPLLVDGDVMGVLHVGSLSPRVFGPDDVRLLEAAAARIGPAIEYARLYDAERTARRAAEDAVTELRALQSLSDAALAHLDLDDMLQELLERLRTALGADTAAVLILDTESDELVARAARGLEEEVERGVRVPVGRGFAGRIAAERRVVEVPDIDKVEVVNLILRDKGIRSLLGAPLIASDEVRGVVHVGTLTPRDFSAADSRLMQLAADRIAMALEHSRLLREHNVALTLQRSLLPERLPDVAGLRVAARYRPGQGGMVGGDWYDAVPLPAGGVGLAMGDVVSRGVRAASVMGQLRQSLRAHAVDGARPPELVERLAGAVRALDRREMVTLSYAEVDATGRELRHVSAGHPPPLLIEGGEARFLEEARGAPLGAVPNPRYADVTHRLPPDSLIVLYTDGLVERRGRSMAEGMERLARCATSAGSDPERIADAIMEDLVDEATVDDVALLVVRTVAHVGNTLDLRLPAVATSLIVLRRSLRQWLADNGATGDDILDVIISVGEAAGNAVEHAYGPGDASFDVTATVDAGELDLTVRDYGSWRPPRGQNRGRGTLLMQELMDGFEVRATEHGTEVRLRRKLGKRAAA
jgi:serine phosphatase RsbU (regulator of sigma subunit)/putative methionine-R-sulfoxide reductase with GAF domain/anti-sigma regulatory factor (Ser/Thr protein kinase)